MGKKKYIFSLFFITVLTADPYLYSQITSSPYSIFGLGSTEGNGTGVTNAMGGTGIAMASGNFLNLQNPALAVGMDSIYTICELGFQGKYTTFSSAKKSQSLFDANFNYAAMGFRIKTVWAVTAGIAPYSTIGYNINVKSEIEGTTQTFLKSYSGEGGVNKIFLANAIRIRRNLFFGVNAVYLFGTVNHSESSDDFNYSLKNVTWVSNFNFNYGLNYQFKGKKWKYNIGFIYDNGKTLLTNKVSTLTTASEVETENSSERAYKVPRSYGIGFAFVKDYFRGGIDFETRRWKDIDFDNPMLESRNSNRYSLGLEIPSAGYNRGSSHMVFYRLGAQYCQSYMVINKNPVNYRSVSVGAGIPVKGYLSVFNVSIELGRNGTLNSGLFRETFCTFHVDISLKEIWFAKRRFN